MHGRLIRDGLDPHSTTLRAWCSAVWAALVDLLVTGVKVEELQKLWRTFDTPDRGANGVPDRDTWGLLPEHQAAQQQLLDAAARFGGGGQAQPAGG